MDGKSSLNLESFFLDRSTLSGNIALKMATVKTKRAHRRERTGIRNPLSQVIICFHGCNGDGKSSYVSIGIS